MNLHFKQSQFELFPQGPSSTGKIGRSPLFFSSLTLSLENIITLGIIVVMSMVFFFSLGVERGRKRKVDLSSQSLATNVEAKRQNVVMQPAADNASSGPAALSNSNAGSKEAFDSGEEVPVTPMEEEELEGAYTVQVASFKKGEYAQKEAGTLRKKGFDIVVVPKGKHYIVCVGRFSEKDKAKGTLNRLQKSYKDSILRRL